jgi:hypothetical protein
MHFVNPLPCRRRRAPVCDLCKVVLSCKIQRDSRSGWGIAAFWPTDKLNTLRLGQRLIAEVAAKPGRRDGHHPVARVADQARICQLAGTVPGLQFAATGRQDVAVRAGDA